MTNNIDEFVEYIKKESMKYNIKQAFGDTRVDVYSNELYSLRWLENYHIGYFNENFDDIADIILYGLYIKSEIFFVILNKFLFTDRVLMFFQHEGYYYEKQNYKIFYDPQSYYIHIVEDKIHFLLILDNQIDNFRIIERIQIELLFNQISQPHIRFHAASICNDFNEGTLIIGCKGSGKTSLSLGL